MFIVVMVWNGPSEELSMENSGEFAMKDVVVLSFECRTREYGVDVKHRPCLLLVVEQPPIRNSLEGS